MYTNKIQESFKRHFEAFFKSRNVFWHSGVFAGSRNGLFTYSYAFDEKSDDITELNLIFFVAPVFSVKRSKVTYETRYGLSMRELILLENLDVNLVFTDVSEIDEVMNRCLQLMEKYFDKYFTFSSVTEYCEKMLNMGMKIVDFLSVNPQHTQMLYQKLSEIDFVDICYYYLKAEGQNRCRQFTMELVSGLRVALYDSMKYDNLTGLSEKFSDTELEKIDKIFINYSRVTKFLESLLLHNDSYFITVEEKFKNSELEGNKIVSDILT